MNPFELRGTEFLFFYLIFSAVVIAALLLARRISESGSAPKIDLSDPYLIAHLRGGENEALSVGLVSLIDRGLLIVNGKQIQRANNAGPDSVRRPIERALIESYVRPGEATSIFNDSRLKFVCTPYEETLKANLLTGSQCDLLLDLHNLHANALNFDFDPINFINGLPAERIASVHLAGGKWIGEQGAQRLLDDHLHDVPDSVYDLLVEVGARTRRPLTVILERDGDFPSMDCLLRQLEEARESLAKGRARRIEQSKEEVAA